MEVKYVIFLIQAIFVGAECSQSGDFCSRNSTEFPCVNIKESYVHKCNCKLNEAWHDPYCLKQATSIPVVQLDPWKKHIIPSHQYYGEVVSELACTSDEILTPLTDNTFYLLTSGELLHLFTGVIYSLQKYCIEHVVDYSRKTIRLGAYVCVARPEIPLCCGNGEYLDGKTFQCVPDPSFNISPPIYKEPSILRWNSLPGYRQGLPQCYDNEIYRQLNLENTKTAVLLYRSNGIFLHWRTPHQRQAHLTNPYDYCVTAEKKGRRYYHSAFVCLEPVPLQSLATKSEQITIKRPRLYVLPVMYFFFGIG